METTESKSILIIESNPRNLELLSRFLIQQGYEGIPLSSLDQLEETLEKIQIIRLAMVDISGYDHSIWDYCEKIRQKGIPLLIVSAKQSASIQRESMTHGASGVLVKPLVMRELTLLIAGILEE